MTQHTDIEVIERTKANAAFFAKKDTNHAPAPPIISKKWLLVRYGYQQPSGRMNYRVLYSRILTARVLAALDLTEQEVRCRGFKDFDAERSALLKNILQL